MVSRSAQAKGEASPETDLAERLRKVTARLVRRLRSQNSVGPSLGQISILEALANSAPTLGQLAKIEVVTSPSMTASIDRLERQRLAKRSPDEHDGRVVRVQITNAGRRILAEHHAVANTYFNELLATLNAEQRETLSRAIQVLDSLLDL